MSHVFLAQYHGRCAADCDEPIRPGQPVRYEGTTLVHDECNPEVTGRREPTVCPRCFLAHAGECF